MARVRVYVDGFNLYYGALKPAPALKWLDLVAFCDRIRPGDSVDHVRYFTARVSGAQDVTSPGRQQLYLKALEMLPRISIHFGQFRTHEVMMPMAGNYADQVRTRAEDRGEGFRREPRDPASPRRRRRSVRGGRGDLGRL